MRLMEVEGDEVEAGMDSWRGRSCLETQPRSALTSFGLA